MSNINLTENLLTTVSEECAEIAEAVSKALRFGLKNHHPLKPDETNAKKILVEFYQLTALIDLLQGDQLPFLDTKEIIRIQFDKTEEVEYWIKKSKEFGTLVEED